MYTNQAVYWQRQLSTGGRINYTGICANRRHFVHTSRPQSLQAERSEVNRVDRNKTVSKRADEGYRRDIREGVLTETPSTSRATEQQR